MYTMAPATSNPTAWKWTAPEGLNDAEFSIKSDVWSFGIVLLELCTFGKKPYSEHQTCSYDFKTGLTKGVGGGVVMEPSKTWPQLLQLLMVECWEVQPNARPTFATLHKGLERSMRKRFNSKKGSKSGRGEVSAFGGYENLQDARGGGGP